MPMGDFTCRICERTKDADQRVVCNAPVALCRDCIAAECEVVRRKAEEFHSRNERLRPREFPNVVAEIVGELEALFAELQATPEPPEDDPSGPAAAPVALPHDLAKVVAIAGARVARRHGPA